MDWTFMITIGVIAILLLIVLVLMLINWWNGKDEVDCLLNFFVRKKKDE
jgi:hypothetical protein